VDASLHTNCHDRRANEPVRFLWTAYVDRNVSPGGDAATTGNPTATIRW
jgi:hypothetical protein